MARSKAILNAGVRLSDHLSVSLLARIYPPELLHEVLNQHSAGSQRMRSFPALTVGYYCIALSFYPEVAYESVFASVADGLAWAQGQRSGAAGRQGVPSLAKSSISAARTKLGAAPLRTLYERACVPLADAKRQPEAFYQGLRLVALDGSHFEVPDEAANAAAFGYPGSRTGVAAYPQAHCVVLAECATHAILGANIGAYRTSEWSLCAPLLARLSPNMLCLADRGFNGYAQWQAASNTGAQLLWRCAANRQLPVIQALADGSYLSAIYPDKKLRSAGAGEIAVRVIEYSLPGLDKLEGGDQGVKRDLSKTVTKAQRVRANQKAQQSQKAKKGAELDGHESIETGGDAPTGQRYRLITTLLDPARYPALELAGIYHERWEVEAVFDELKTHLAQRRRTLRSKTPEGVRQEFYGWVLAHYAVCWLMHQGASAHRIRQRILSFTGNVQLFKRSQPRSGAFPPSAAQTAGSFL
jgi:hypothetical protein